jgi:hypothetical protein
LHGETIERFLLKQLNRANERMKSAKDVIYLFKEIKCFIYLLDGSWSSSFISADNLHFIEILLLLVRINLLPLLAKCCHKHISFKHSVEEGVKAEPMQVAINDIN